jgi:ABC-2 type transport system permease protein
VTATTRTRPGSPTATARAHPSRAAWLRIASYAVARKRLAPLTWALPLALMSVMVLAVFPSIESSAQLDELIKAYPDALKEAFGISDASFRTIDGYLAAEVFSLIAPFATSYFVIHTLATGICGAEQRGDLDVLLSAPIWRRQLLAGWFAGSAATLLAIAVVLGLITQLGAFVTGVDLAPADTLAGVLNLWPLGVFFGGVTLLLAGIWRGPGTVTGAAAAVLVAMYLIEVLGKLSSAMARADGVSAFHYYGSAIEDGLDLGACAGLTVAGVILAAAGCVLFERRDVGT